MNYSSRLIVFLLLFTTQLLSAQSITIKGNVTDSLQQPLVGASILLLSQADSVLTKFDITQQDGSFQLNDVEKGAYWFRATYIGYQTYGKAIDVSGVSPIDLGNILLEPISETLETVVVEAERAPIIINGDTIQYNADAFRTQPNAVVEDLLKKLPGVEVDRNGQIRAQGKDVDRVLVDGKEFFTDDPQIATQNLPADIVDNVQVFDQRSETAEFTGIDDGERNTTINLQLKDDKKQGYFGTLEAGYGTEDRFATKGNINRFNSDYQLSVIGRYNNINQQGFTLQDYFNLMGGVQNALSGNNAISPRDLGISLDGSNRMDGFTDNGAGGVNLNYDLSRRTELSVNYFYNHIDRVLDRTIERENAQGEQAFFNTNEIEDRNAINNNHRFNSLLRHDIDSTQDIQLRVNLGFNDMGLSTNSFRQVFGSNQHLESTIDKDYSFDNKQFNLDSRLVYRRRMSKLGRAFVTDLRYGLRSEDGDHLLSSLSVLEMGQSSDSLMQNQLNENTQDNYALRLTYTEPLKNGYFTELTYRRQNYNEVASRDFYDLFGNQMILNPELTNRFTSDYTIDRVGLTLQRNRKNSTLALSIDMQESRLKGDLQSEQFPLKRSFTNLLPGFRWRYEFSSTKNVRIRYQTNLQEPSIQQLQPIVDNSDPFNIYIGNPALKPEYQHQLLSQFMWYDAFSFTSIFFMLDARYTENKITDATSIDEQLRQTITPLNVENDLLLRGNISFGSPIRPLKIQANIDANTYYNRGFLFLNDLENTVDRFNQSLSFSLENRKKDVVDIIVGTEWTYQNTSYTLNSELNQQFNTQSYLIDCSVQLGPNWRINSVLDYTIFPQGPFEAREERPIWEASVTRSFGKQQRGQLKLHVFDILDRNTGLNRNATFNFIENERIASLGRYVMLSMAYSLKGFGK